MPRAAGRRFKSHAPLTGRYYPLLRAYHRMRGGRSSGTTEASSFHFSRVFTALWRSLYLPAPPTLSSRHIFPPCSY